MKMQNYKNERLSHTVYPSEYKKYGLVKLVKAHINTLINTLISQ